MADETNTPGPFGKIEKGLPVMGKAIGGAIDRITFPDNPYVYFLLVLDPETGAYVWTSDAEAEGMRAALQEFLTKHAH